MTRPHALQFGPDGALYMIEWGSGFDGNNADSGVYRIDYVEGERSPTARATTNKTSGPAPLTVTFDGTTSIDGDTGTNAGLTYAWDFTNDGTVDATTPTASYTYSDGGQLHRSSDGDGRERQDRHDEHRHRGGQLRPDGRPATCRSTVASSSSATPSSTRSRSPTRRTAPIDCSKVTVQPGLGHDQHSHGYEQYTGLHRQLRAAR